MSYLLQEGVKTENDHISMKVARQDGYVIQFKVKRHTPLSKLMKAYCERQVRLWAGCDSTATARPGCSGLHCPGSVCLHMYAVCVCVCLHVCMHSCACVPCVCVYKSVHVPWSSSLFSPLNLQVVPISSCLSRQDGRLPLPHGG